MSWRPIETAPRDGTIIDLWAGGKRLADCKWMSDDFYRVEEQGDFYAHYDWAKVREYHGTPTHWMPLPPPPVVKESLTPALPMDDDLDEPLGQACSRDNPECDACQ